MGIVKDLFELIGTALIEAKRATYDRIAGKKALEAAYKEIVNPKPSIAKIERLLRKAKDGGIDSEELDRAFELLGRHEDFEYAASGGGSHKKKPGVAKKKAAKKTIAERKPPAKKKPSEKKGSTVKKKPSSGRLVKRKPASISKRIASKASSGGKRGARK